MMRRRAQRKAVGLVCFLLAALLLVLTLQTQIRLRGVERELEALQSERADLIEERRLLDARLAGQMNLSEIERRATQELGMRRCRGDQQLMLVIEDGDDEYK